MSYCAREIDEVRDLVIKKHNILNGNIFQPEGYSHAVIDEAKVEREVLTYLSQDITIIDLRNTVDQLEKDKRVERERKQKEYELAERDNRVRKVVQAAIEAASGKEPFTYSETHYDYEKHKHNTTINTKHFEEDAKAVMKELESGTLHRDNPYRAKMDKLDA